MIRMKVWRQNIVNYTIVRKTIHNFSLIDRDFVRFGAIKLNEKYDNRYDWKNFDLYNHLARGNYLAICYRDKEPVGFLFASFYKSFFEPNLVILQQNTLFCLPNTRGANLLMKDFIDFGKANANHVITMIGRESNIKPRSLENLGFKELETLYLLEV